MKTITKTTLWAVAMVTTVTGASADVNSAERTLTKHDQLKIAVQQICPVSGKPLGSMGTPPKVKVGAEEIFLCCKGCIKGEISKDHWKAIHLNFAKAQATCPVMEKALPANPKFTVVRGQIVYVCCPPCTKKIEAEPEAFIKKIDNYYETSLKKPAQRPVAASPTNARSTDPVNRDELRMATQRICPVSGRELSTTGQPIKVKAGEIELFLCCEGCKEGKINKDHWATIRGNIAKAQGVCPVMEKKLPANAKSTIVDGQLVFVCCPPCTKKIEADPHTFLPKVERYLMSSLSSRSQKR